MLILCPNFITTLNMFVFQYNPLKSEVFIKVIGISSDIFSKLRTSLGNHPKSSEVAVTFSEILVMTRRKSHAFNSEKSWQV